MWFPRDQVLDILVVISIMDIMRMRTMNMTIWMKVCDLSLPKCNVFKSISNKSEFLIGGHPMNTTASARLRMVNSIELVQRDSFHVPIFIVIECQGNGIGSRLTKHCE